MFHAVDWETLRGRKAKPSRGHPHSCRGGCGAMLTGRRAYCEKWECSMERELREAAAQRAYFKKRDKRRAEEKRRA